MSRIAQLGYTVLILTAAHGHADCMRLLLEAGADKDARDAVCCSRNIVGTIFFCIRDLSGLIF
jgi:ankyrin repeat protein